MFGLKKIKRNSMDKELEEVLPKNSNGKYSRNEIETAFEVGAKWQAERMYSEEEVLELLWKREWCYEHSMPFITVDKWFEQLKKK